jgi:GTPase SAR1 family protein
VGALIVYDVTRRQSFENVKRWWEELKQHSSEEIAVILVGNKIDLEN